MAETTNTETPQNPQPGTRGTVRQVQFLATQHPLWVAAALGAMLLFGAAVRLYMLGSSSLWVDEIATAYYVQPGSSWLFTATNPVLAPLPAPPGIFLITRLAAWIGQSEFLLRFPAFLFGVLGIAVTYRFARSLFGLATGLAAAFLLTVSRFQIHYSQDARYYPELLVFGLLDLYCFWRALGLNTSVPFWRTDNPDGPGGIYARHRRIWWIGFGVTTFIGIYVHLFMLFLPMVQTMFVAWLLLQEILYARSEHRSLGPFIRHVLVPFVTIGVILLVLYAPMFPFVITGLGGPRGVGTGQRPPFTFQVVLQYFLIMFNGFSAGNTAASYIFFMLFVLGAVIMAARRRRDLVLLLLYMFVPISVVAIIRPQHFFSAKYVIFDLPVYYAFVAYAVYAIVERFRSTSVQVALGTAIALVLALFSIATYNTYYATEKQDWRSAVAFLSQVAKPGDALIVAGSKVAFGAAEPLEYAFKYYGLKTPNVVIGAESPFQDAFPLQKKYQQYPRVWVLLTPSKTNHQLRAKWLNNYQPYHYTKITVFFRDNQITDETARRAEINDYYQVALATKINWRTSANLASTLAKTGQQPAAVAQLAQALKANPEKASFYLGLGKLYLAQKQYDVAEQFFNQAVKIESPPGPIQGFLIRLFTQSKKPAQPPFSVSRPYTALGKLAMLRKQYDAARNFFQNAINLNPDDSRPHIGLAQAYAAVGLQDDAVNQFNQAIQIQSKSARPRTQLAKYYRKHNQLDQALAQFQIVETLKGSRPHVHTVLGQLYKIKGNLDQASVEFAQAAALRPSKMRPFLLQGILYLKQDRTTEAAALLQRAANAQPTKSRPHVVLGTLYEKQHQLGLAQAEFQNAAKLEPGKNKPLQGLAKFYREQGRYQDMLAAAQKVPHPQTLARFLQAQAEELLGNNAAALADFQAAINANPQKGRPHVDLAHFYATHGQRDSANAELQKAMQLEPNDGRVYLAAGRFQIALKKYDAAKPLLDQALKLSPNKAGPHLAMGRNLVLKKDYANGLVELQAAARLAPNKARPFLLMGKANLSTGNYEEAASQFDQAARLQPGLSRPSIGRGLVFYKQSRFAEAAGQFQDAVGLDPSKARAYVLHGKSLAKQGQWKDAITQYQLALSAPAPATQKHHLAIHTAKPEARPYLLIALADNKLNQLDDGVTAAIDGIRLKQNAARGHVVLATLYSSQKRTDAATAEFQNAINLQPKKEKPQLLFGLMKAHAGDATGAEQAYLQAIKIKDKSRPHALLGKLYQSAKRTDDATQQYQLAIQLAPSKARGYLLTGRLHALKKDWNGALAAFQNAIQFGPVKPRARIAAGVAYFQLKQDDNAVAKFQQAIAMEPNKARPYLTWGRLLKKRKKYDAALPQFQKAVGLKPTQSHPHVALGHLYLKKKQYDLAAGEYLTGLSLKGIKPDKPRAHFALARIYLRDKTRLDDALTQLQITASLHFNKGRFHVLLGKADLKKGFHEKARTEFNTALGMIPKKVRPHIMVGRMIELDRKYEAALAEYKAALAIKDKARPYVFMGLLFVDWQKPDDARVQYNTAAAKNPTRARPYILLGYLEESLRDVKTTGQYDAEYRAIAAFQLALGRKQKPRAYLALGRIYQRMNKLDQALPSLLQAVALKPTLVAAHFRLALIYEKYQQWSNAIEEWQIVLSLRDRGRMARIARVHLANLEGVPYTPRLTRIQQLKLK